MCVIQGSETGEKIYHELVVYRTDNGNYELLIKMDREGHYVGWVKYQGIRVGLPKFTIISLSGEIVIPFLCLPWGGVVVVAFIGVILFVVCYR